MESTRATSGPAEPRRLDLDVEPQCALDVLATADSSLPFPDVFNLMKSQMATEDREAALEALTSLQSDHYVLQETGGGYRFRYPLIQRWWRIHRSL